MALQLSKFLSRHPTWKFLQYQPLRISQRSTTHDHTNTLCGKRDYVGFGVNGSPIYVDIITHPMPAIRFQEPTPEICALREKEKDDWKNLSKDEIKRLYRYSFCKTFSEMQAPTGEWKLHVGVAIWACTIALLFTYAVNVFHQDLPAVVVPTIDPNNRSVPLVVSATDALLSRSLASRSAVISASRLSASSSNFPASNSASSSAPSSISMSGKSISCRVGRELLHAIGTILLHSFSTVGVTSTRRLFPVTTESPWGLSPAAEGQYYWILQIR